MRTTGKILLAIGTGLGVWLITNPTDIGATDILIVATILITGGWLAPKQTDE